MSENTYEPALWPEEGSVTLTDLISALEQVPQDEVIHYGFCHPHSYRGYYRQLAFEARLDVPVAEMLADAKVALGSVYHGWKGGLFPMGPQTGVFIVTSEGCTGTPLSPMLLSLILGSKLEIPVEWKTLEAVTLEDAYDGPVVRPKSKEELLEEAIAAVTTYAKVAFDLEGEVRIDISGRKRLDLKSIEVVVDGGDGE